VILSSENQKNGSLLQPGYVVMLKASSKINFSKVIKEINTQKPIRKIA